MYWPDWASGDEWGRGAEEGVKQGWERKGAGVSDGPALSRMGWGEEGRGVFGEGGHKPYGCRLTDASPLSDPYVLSVLTGT